MGGLATSCVASACCCAECSICEADATTFGLDELKKRLEGQRIRAKTNPNTEPEEVYLTFLRVDKKDGGSIRFTPQKFMLRELEFLVEVEIHGTKGHLLQKAATKSVDVSLEKAGVNRDRRAGMAERLAGAGSKIGAASTKIKDKVGISSKEVHTITVDVTLNLTKEFENEEVDVEITDLQIDHKVLQRFLSIDALRKHIKRVVSQKLSEVATKLGRKKADEFKENMPVAAKALGY